LSVNRLELYACERFRQRIKEARTCRYRQLAVSIAYMGNICPGFGSNESTGGPIPLMEAAFKVSIE
jgi:hypothetical protein